MAGADIGLGDRLNRYLDAHVRHGDGRANGHSPRLDPDLVQAIDRLDARDDAPAADPIFVERLLEEIMASTVNPGVLRNDGVMGPPVPETASGGGFTLLPWIPRRGQGSRWALAQLATAALITLALVSSFFAFGPGRPGRQPEESALIPAIVATPATPEVAPAPIAEFVWETHGGPDVPFENKPFPANIDPAGNLWVADAPRHHFQIFAPDGTYLESWGTPGSGPGEFNFLVQAAGDWPSGDVAFDGDGNIFVTDPGNFRVQKFGPDRSFISEWGGEGHEDGQFLWPADIQVGADGNIYVPDGFRYDVQAFDRDGRFIRAIGSFGFDDGQFRAPTGLGIDGEGDLWVVDTERNRVQEFSPEGELVSAWGEQGFAPGQLLGVIGVAVDAEGHLFIPNSGKENVQVFAADGTFLGSWGRPGKDPGEFFTVENIVLDGHGYVYVGDLSNKRIQKFRLLPPFGPAEPEEAKSAEAAPAPIAEFLWETHGGVDVPFEDKPYAVTLDPDGNLWVLDGPRHQFQVFGPDGTYLESWGTPGSGDGEFNFIVEVAGWPSGDVAFDKDGNFYVSDPGNLRIQKFGPDRQFIAAWGSRGDGDGQFLWPGQVEVDSQGRVYVPDEFRHDVQVFDSDGTFLRAIGGYGEGDGQLNLGGGSSIAVDADDNLWVIDSSNYRLQKFSPGGEFLAKWGKTGYEPGNFAGMAGLALDSEGRVYVSQSVGDKVQIFGTDGVFLGAWGGSGSDPGEFFNPQGLVVDGEGSVYVSDFGNKRVQKFRLNVPAAATLPATAVDMLIDTRVPNMPGGLITIMVDHWFFPSEPSTLSFPEQGGGPTIVVAPTEGFVVTSEGNEQAMTPGEPVLVPRAGSLRKTGNTPETAISVGFVDAPAAGKHHPGIYAENSVEAMTDVIPAGPADVMLERITLPVGETFPPFVASNLEWIGIGPGNLGVTLTGEGQSEWTSGKERLVLPHFPPPQLTPGWQVTLRNTGDEPVVAYRLVVTPLEPLAATAEVLADTTVNNMPSEPLTIMVDHWSFPVESRTLLFPAMQRGPTVVAATDDGFVVTVEGDEQPLAPDESVVIPTEGTIANSGGDEASVFTVGFWPLVSSDIVAPGVSVATATRATTDLLPTGPAQVVLERITLAPGEAYPPFVAADLEWIGAGPGSLGVALTGEGESAWTSGKERSILPHFSAPQLTPGWEVTLRNTGDTPVDAYRLRVTPLSAPMAAPSTTTETLIDMAVPNMPGGNVILSIDRYFLPGATTLTLPARSGGPTIIVASSSDLLATVDGVEQELTPDTPLHIPTEGSLANLGPTEADALLVSFLTSYSASVWSADAGITFENPLEDQTDVLPAGPARVVLERISLAPGAAYPPFVAADLEWIGVGPGNLGVTLTGEGDSAWTSGKQRLVTTQFAAPRLTPGWEVTLRNMGDAPVEAYRLRVTPLEAPAATPVGVGTPIAQSAMTGSRKTI